MAIMEMMPQDSETHLLYKVISYIELTKVLSPFHMANFSPTIELYAYKSIWRPLVLRWVIIRSMFVQQKKKTTRRKIYNSTLSYKLIPIEIWKVDDLIIVVGVTQKLVLPATIDIFHNRLNCRGNGLYCTEFSNGLVVILVFSSRSSKF